MIGAYASLLVLLLASCAIGQAIVAISRGTTTEAPEPFAWVSPAVGLGAMLVIAGIAARLPGEGLTAALALAVATLAALWFLRGRVGELGAALRLAAPVVALTTLAVSLPYAIAGNVGILGAGLVNDDMASHLLIADYVSEPSGFVPTFIRGGYPIGPHAVVAALAEGLGTGIVEAFAGLTLVLAPLLGLVALGLLGELPYARRVTGACLVAVPFLAVSFLAQGAFKEPLQALILIGFALLFAALIGIPASGAALAGSSEEAPAARAVHPLLRVLPLGLLAAAAVFNYSLPGLLWIFAICFALTLARVFAVKPKPVLPEGWQRRALPYALGALGVLALATAQEWSRIADFARLEALNPDRFGSDLGNLRQAISPTQALGIWPSGEYGIAASDAGLPAIAFYAGGLLAAAAAAGGVVYSIRRDRWAMPAALAAIAAVWAVTALFSTPYIAAKALAIASPVVMVLAVRGVLGGSAGLSPPRMVAALVFVVAAGLSSLLALRQAPVGPEAHATELAEVREVVQDERVLFLGRDDFIAWELRGSDEITGIVTNYYSVEDVRRRFQQGEGGGEKFDVDAVFPATLDSFRYILATTGGPASSTPPRFDPVVETENYVLYERLGDTGRRKTLEEGAEPGAVFDCTAPGADRIRQGKGTAQVWTREPLIGPEDRWLPSPEPTDERTVRQPLRLLPGRWQISLAYDSRRPLRVTSPELGIDTVLDANLDFRGPTPTFPVAEVEVSEPTHAEIGVSVERPNLLARALRAPNEAHLRTLTATPLGVVERIQRRQMCDAYVDWYRARG